MTRPSAAAVSAREGIGRVVAARAEVRAAVSFLTRLPIRRSPAELDRTGAAAFGLVGAGIGMLGAVPLVLLGQRLPFPAAVLAILLVVVASGALHLDGLGDTADALVAPDPEAAERARTDPRAGAAGVTAIVLDLLLGTSLLATISAADPRLAGAALVVAAAASRASATVAGWIDRQRRSAPRGGLGGWFATRVEPIDVVAVAATIVILVVVLARIVPGGDVIALGVAAAVVVAAAVGSAIVARRGRLDGDGYGAIVEITFVAVLAGIAVQLPILPR
jgi:adenosylcobinamide-GDP ribazoletransferase